MSLLPPLALHAPLPLFHWSLLALALAVAALLDVRARRVPNWLTVAALLVGVAARVLAGGVGAGAWGIGGAATGLALLWIPFARRMVGGGDVKLLAAGGAWLGPLLVVYAALVGAVAGGMLSLLYLARSPRAVRRDIAENLKAAALLQRAPEVQHRPLRLSPPYALAIALGVATVVALYARQLVVWS